MNQSICILTTAYPTWKEGKNEVPRGKFVHDMAKSFVKNGCNVFIITNHGTGTKDFEKKDGVNIYRFHYFFPRWEVLTKGDGIPENIKKFKNKLLVPLYFFSFALKAISIIRKNRINIINAHWAIPTGYIALWIKALTRRKLVTTIYGAEIFPIASGKMKALKPFVRKALNKADIVVGISKATVDSAKELSGRKDIYVIPDGIDIEYYKPGPANTKLLEKYNCKGKKVVFFTGRMVERKGHRYLLEAMRYVKNELPNAKLVLGGKGELFEELKNLRREWKLEEFVEMPGFIPEEEIVPLLQSVDLFVLPSCIDKNGDTEGSATAALEAMACGTPAIISEVGGNIGAIQHGNGAYYFNAADAEDLAKKAISTLSDRSKLKALSLSARDAVDASFSWQRVINAYMAVIRPELSGASSIKENRRSKCYQTNYSKLYPEEVANEQNRQEKAKKTLAVIKDALPRRLSECNVLEIGCFTGEISISLAATFSEYVAIDIDARALDIASKKTRPDNLKFVNMNAEELAFRDESFDIVICSHVYEHVPNPRRMMDEVHRVLKLKGCCYFAAGNRMNIVEPHYGLPFLSWLPRPLAHLYLKLSRRGNYYYESLLGYSGLKKLVRGFEITDYTLQIIYNPSRFFAEDMLTEGSIRQSVGKFVYKYLRLSFPAYIWVLTKIECNDSSDMEEKI